MQQGPEWAWEWAVTCLGYDPLPYCVQGIASKLRNVSNKANYTQEAEQFLARFVQWQPTSGKKPPHPRPGSQ